MFIQTINILHTMLFLIRTQLIMLYNILFQVVFGKSDVQNMFKHVSDLMKIKYSGEVDKINSNANIYLFNHVSWTDFFMDNNIIGGSGCYFSRIAVFFAVPFTSIYGLLNNIIFFSTKVIKL